VNVDFVISIVTKILLQKNLLKEGRLKAFPKTLINNSYLNAWFCKIVVAKEA